MYEGVLVQLGDKQPGCKDVRLDTIDKAEKFLHDRAGLLTMSTEGNIGSFGITLGDAGSLDDTNTIFGEVVGNTGVVHEIYDYKVDADTHRPDVRFFFTMKIENCENY
jgi:cyclophilin family peptidyl-prolyl cis-trans isomerase